MTSGNRAAGGEGGGGGLGLGGGGTRTGEGGLVSSGKGGLVLTEEADGGLPEGSGLYCVAARPHVVSKLKSGNLFKIRDQAKASSAQPGAIPKRLYHACLALSGNVQKRLRSGH